jgi:hypothetical protein
MTSATILPRSRSLPTVPALAFAAVLVTLSATTAHAVPLPTFPTVEPGPSATQWYPDRYRPAGFANVGTLFGRNNVLAITIDDADSEASRPPPFNGSTFYNTQGRKIDIDTAPPVTWIGSLYIPSAWATTNPADPSLTRRSDLWATLSDAVDAPTWFPIIGFTNANGTTFNGGTGRYRVWDNVNGVWIDLAQPVAYDAWTNFSVTFTGTTIEYRIGTTLVHTETDPAIASLTVASDVMFQAYNFGYDYVANWSYAGYGQSRTSAQLLAEFAPLAADPGVPVPIGPLAPALSALALAALAALRLRRRR